jgi:hypothetical protein
MRRGHDTEGFSAIYEFTMGDNGKEPEHNSIGDRRQSLEERERLHSDNHGMEHRLSF